MNDARSGFSRCRAASLLAALPLALICHPAASDATGRDQASGAQSRYSSQLLDSINAYRAKRGVPALRTDANLNGLAYEHSKDMARIGKLNHDGYRERGMRSGSEVCVENVGWNYATPEAQLKAWIASPGHNQNMLDAKVTKAGTGDANAYVTFIACR